MPVDDFSKFFWFVFSQEYVKVQVRAAKKANREVKYNHAKMNDIYYVL